MQSRDVLEFLFICLFAGVLIEVVFRIIGRFPAYTRSVFRWMYVGLLGGLTALLAGGIFRQNDQMFTLIVKNEKAELGMIGFIFICSVLINIKGKKQVE